ncbi:helix-hairpin-helix domain-containing protein [Actinopolymorpha rutila]|uniref:Pathogenicity locus n=1 Tax=Actinopolymorpha rutila TaxID=446787 RepID=A0A852ZLI7_9ACTN|nr:helix-hairpin-helix domain-containing protein [Actinopolymorpha rutila]NYH92748.1 hypothetical protein [Actinopolymorpha rutila]
MSKKSPDSVATAAGASGDLLAMANVGPAVVGYLARLGITERGQLVGRDPFELYDTLCLRDGRRYDPCLLDTFMSVVDQAGGGQPRPWWKYTAERKRALG